MIRWFIALLLCVASAGAAGPAFVLPGAVRLDRKSDGGMIATLSDGARAWIQPIREGYSVNYSDGRAAQRWTRTATGYTVTSLGSAGGNDILRMDGRIATKASGARVRVSPTRTGKIVREDTGSTVRWTPTRDGWTAYPSP